MRLGYAFDVGNDRHTHPVCFAAASSKHTTTINSRSSLIWTPQKPRSNSTHRANSVVDLDDKLSQDNPSQPEGVITCHMVHYCNVSGSHNTDIAILHTALPATAALHSQHNCCTLSSAQHHPLLPYHTQMALLPSLATCAT